ncbi:MAG TPA: hypothetical protein VLD57_01740 [Blastocatellia bacterium]|nr:hypothetical protein [Blastocatellia bacterium]
MRSPGKIITIVLATLLLIAVVSATGHGRQKAGARRGRALSLEEKLIRSAYARLMVFNKAARLRKAEDEGSPRQPEHDLRFEISNVKSGPIEEILDRLWGDVVTRRLGDVLSIVPGLTSHNGGPKHAYYMAEWEDAGHRSLSSLSETVRDVLGREPSFADLGKYTSYDVTVHFEGRQRSYRAMVVYHQPLQSVRETRAEFLDNVVGSFALGEALSEQNPPMRFPWKEFIRSRAYMRGGVSPGRADMRFGAGRDPGEETRPFFREENDLSAPEQEMGERETAFKQTRRNLYGGFCDYSWMGMCCDWLTLQCCFPYETNYPICDDTTCGYPTCNPDPIGGGGGGGGSEEPGCTSDTRRGQEVIKSFEDFQYHFYVDYITRHSGWAKFRPKCVTESSCATSCFVNLYGSPAYGYYDDGPSTTIDGKYHAVQIKTDDRSGGTTVRGETVSCSAAVAMAFKACTDKACGFAISLTLGPTGWTVTSEGFFDAVMQHSWECRAPR